MPTFREFMDAAKQADEAGDETGARRLIDLARKAQLTEQTSKSEDPSLVRTGAGLVADVGISESAKFGGAALGTAVFPGVGTAIGYVSGAIIGGVSGSITRQKIMRPDESVRYGEILSDTLINFIPGGKAVKTGSFFRRAATTGSKSAIKGAGIGASSEVIETAVDEGRFPSLEEIGERAKMGAALAGALGISSEAASKAYQKFAGLPTSSLDAAYRAKDPNAIVLVDGMKRINKNYLAEVTKNQKAIITRIDENAANQYAPVLALQDQAGGGQIKRPGSLRVKSDESDYYQTRVLAEGRIAAQNERIESRIKEDGLFLQERSKDLGMSGEQLSKEVNDYIYAKHAVAYNKQHGDNAAGITTEQANNFIKDFQKRGLDIQLEGSISSRTSASKEILDVLEKGGLIEADLAKKLRKIYPEYVPLNRVMDDAPLNEGVRIVGGKYETTGTGVMRAQGSEREVRDITYNIYESLSNAYRRVEVNRANLAFKKLIEDNPGTSVAKITRPKISHMIEILNTSNAAIAARARGQNVPKIKIPIYEQPKNNVVTVFDKGKRFNIELDDPTVAFAMKGTNKEVTGALIRVGMAYNRYLGSINTRYSPEFMVPNLVRDRMEATVNAMAKMKPNQAIRLLNPVGDMKTIVRNLTGAKSNNPKDVELDAIYTNFKNDGGSTGGLALTTVKSVQDKIESLSKNLGKNTFQTAKKINSLVNGINTIFEDSTRFGTYRRGIAAGMTRPQAAFAARNSSFDPLLAGTKGDTFRALYLFSNPAIQASRNLLRTMRNPKVATGVMTSFAGLTYALDKWNQFYDQDWREKINGSSGSNWKTNKNLILVHGLNEDGSLKYASLPVGYSLVPFKVLADYGQRIASGESVSLLDAGKAVAAETMDSYNPTGGSVVPTPLRSMFELYSNKDGFGRDIRPSWLEERNISGIEKVYPWTADTQGGELAMVLAENLEGMGYDVSPENLRYLYQTYTGGPGTTVERLLTITSNLWNSQKIETKDIPIARRFYGNTFAQSFEMRTGQRQIIDTLDKEQNTEVAKANRLAYGVIKDFKKAETAEAKKEVLRQMLLDPERSQPSVVRRVEQKLKDLARGITYSDQQIKQLGIENTARAQFYVEIISTMPPEMRADFLQEQINKRLLTPDVQRQINSLINLKQFLGKEQNR